MTWNNCFLWARWRRRQLRREWIAAGKPVGRAPAMLARPSRLAPDDIDHWVVGWWHPETSALEEIEQFVPLDTSALRWWQLWRVIVFPGRVKRGDLPSKH